MTLALGLGLALAPAATALAAETTIGFDHLPGGGEVAPGTLVTNQWESEGLKMGSAEELGDPRPEGGNCGAPSVAHETAVTEAASKPNYALLARCPVGAGPVVRGSYGALVAQPRGSLSVEVRSLPTGSSEVNVALTAYNSEGIAIEPAVAGKAVQTGWTKLTVRNTAGARISYFSVVASTPNENEIAIDNLSFEATETTTTTTTVATTPPPTESPPGTAKPPPPTAALALLTPSPHAGQPIALSGAGSLPGSGRIISYGWNFGGGERIETSTGTNPTAHLILPPGLHTVTLTVTNSNEEHSTTHLSFSLVSAKIHPPDGGEGECLPRLEFADATLVAECIQKQGEGYVIEGEVALNGMVLAPKSGGFLKIRTVRNNVALGGTETELTGARVYVELDNTPVAEHMVLGERDLETEPIALEFTGGGGLPELEALYHGVNVAEARAASGSGSGGGGSGKPGGSSGGGKAVGGGKPAKQYLMAFAVGHKCEGKESKKAGCCPTTPNSACAELPGNFPLTGEVIVYLTNKGQALFDVQVGLNLKEYNFEATGALQIIANANKGIEMESLKFEIGEASLAPIFKVKGASFEYFFPEYYEESKRDSWQAKGTLTFGEEIVTLKAELEFKHGNFHSAAMEFESEAGVPIYPGISLNEIGASIGVEPLEFGGSLGAKIADLLELKLAFKFREENKEKEELGFFGGKGSLSYKSDEIATLAADVYTDSYVDAEVTFNLHFPFESSSPVIEVKGGAGFWDEPASGLWQAHGNVYLHLWIIGAEVAGLVNNTYAAGCLRGEVFGIEGGIQGRYRFSDGNVDGGVFGNDNCSDQLKQYSEKPLKTHSGGFVKEESLRPAHWPGGLPGGGLLSGSAPGSRSGLAHSAAIGAYDSFDLPEGTMGQELRLTATSGTPVVTLVGPDGQRFTTPAGGEKVHGVKGQFIAAIAPDPNQVLVLLRHPKGGEWRIEPVAGSPAVARLETAEDVPPASVRAHVRHRRGRTFALSYKIAHLVPGSRVRFVERGKDSVHVLGTVSRAKGTLRFTPAEGLSRPRAVLAYMLDSEGAAVRELTVSHYAAPAPFRPGRPRRVRIARHGRTARVTWTAVKGARSYRVKVRGSDGRLETHFRKPNRRSVAIPNVLGFERFTVTVTAIGGKDMLRGPAATGHLKPVKPPKRRARAKRHHRSRHHKHR